MSGAAPGEPVRVMRINHAAAAATTSKGRQDAIVSGVESVERTRGNTALERAIWANLASKRRATAVFLPMPTELIQVRSTPVEIRRNRAHALYRGHRVRPAIRHRGCFQQTDSGNAPMHLMVYSETHPGRASPFRCAPGPARVGDPVTANRGIGP